MLSVIISGLRLYASTIADGTVDHRIAEFTEAINPR
jgi:hypothetical protein